MKDQGSNSDFFGIKIGQSLRFMMKFLARKNQNTISKIIMQILFIVCLFSIFPYYIYAQDNDWIILNPQPDSKIKKGELFIAVSLNPDIAFKKQSVSIFLDGENLTEQAKISQGKITLLYLRTLKSGSHQIEITAKDATGREMPKLSWTFVVEGNGVLPVPATTLTEESITGNGVEFSGNSTLNSRNQTISGAGLGLRQEPSKTNTFRFSGQAKFRSFTFPIKIVATSDENSTIQPRNRLQIGVQSKFLDVYYGSNNAKLEKLILNGARLSGWQGNLHFGLFHLNLVHGDIRRGINGQSNTYQVESGLPPPNLRPDSTFVSGGTFKRKISALRLSLGNARKFLVGFTGLLAKDDTSSIKFGEAPKNNIVAGADLAFNIKRNLFKFKSGAAMSLTINDVSRGHSTKAEIDSLFDTDIPFDPQNYEIIILNVSIIPIDIRDLSSLAWYVNGRLNIFSHSFIAEYKSIGAAYISLGNPFLRNDRRILTLADRFHIYQRKLLVSLRYQRYEDNLSDNQFSTRNSNVLSTNIVLAPDRNWPRLNLGFRTHQRNSDGDVSGRGRTDDAVNTISFGGNYNFRALRLKHGINFFFTRTERNDNIHPEGENLLNTLSLSLNEQLNIPLNINLQFVNLNIKSDTRGTLQSQKTVAGNFNYRFRSGRWNLSFGLRNTSSSKTTFSPKSNRFSVDFKSSYKIMLDMSFELALGFSSYDENGNSDRNYSETFFVIRHLYGFNH